MAVIRLIFVEAVARRGRGEGSKRAQCVNSLFVLRALAAQILLHLRYRACRTAVRKPVIQVKCSEDEVVKDQAADLADIFTLRVNLQKWTHKR